MKYNRYLVAGVILLLTILLIMFAEFVSGSATGYIHSGENSYLNIDTLEKAVLIAIPPLAVGLYILTRHRLKKAEK